MSMACYYAATTTRTRFTTCTAFSISSHNVSSDGRHRDYPILTNLKNPTVKLYKNLQKKRKTREKEQLTVVEGHRMVMDLIELDLKNYRNSLNVIRNDDSGTCRSSDENEMSCSRGLVKHVLVTERALYHKDLGMKLEDLLRSLQSLSSSEVQVSFGTEEVVAECCDTVTPQGVVAMCSMLSPLDVTLAPTRPSSLYIILDGVSDPGNAGTLLRSALAVGVAGVISLPGSCDVYSPKAIRAGMGATFQLPTHAMDSFEEAMDFLKMHCGVQPQDIYAATMDAAGQSNDETALSSSLPYYDVDWAQFSTQTKQWKSAALCLGQEGNGLSTIVREAVAAGTIRSVHVPMQPGIESLNAAVCGSVVMFEYARQRHTLETAASNNLI